MNKSVKFNLLLYCFLLFTPHTVFTQDTILVDTKQFPSNIISLVNDDRGNIWFNTGTGIYQFDGNTIRWVRRSTKRETLLFWEGKLTTFEEVYRKYKKILPAPWMDEFAKFLPPGSARPVSGARDKSGIYWTTQGQNLYGFRINNQFNKSHRGESLRGILQTKDGLLVSTYSGFYLNHKLIYPDSIYSDGNILRYSEHEILFPYHGISNYNLKTGKLHTYAIHPKLLSKIPFDLMAIQKLDSDLLVASGVGLLKLQKDTLYPTPFTKYTEDIYIHDQMLYLATKSGIYKSDGNTFQQLSAFPTLRYNTIQRINGMWWATSEMGLWHWDEKKPHAVRLFKNQELGNLETNSLVKDSKGYYWVSTISGIARFRPDSDTYEHFLQQVEFNKRSMAQIEDTIYFGSTTGLFQFQPSRFPAPTSIATLQRSREWEIPLALGLILSFGFSLGLYLKLRKAKGILDAQKNVSTAVPDPFIARLEQYVEDNMSTVTVDTLSEFAGLSRRGLYRTLEASYGIKPGDLIRNVKRKHIKQLQDENPDLSPEEIAAKVGYSLIHLSRLMER